MASRWQHCVRFDRPEIWTSDPPLLKWTRTASPDLSVKRFYQYSQETQYSCCSSHDKGRALDQAVRNSMNFIKKNVLFEQDRDWGQLLRHIFWMFHQDQWDDYNQWCRYSLFFLRQINACYNDEQTCNHTGLSFLALHQSIVPINIL